MYESAVSLLMQMPETKEEADLFIKLIEQADNPDVKNNIKMLKYLYENLWKH